MEHEEAHLERDDIPLTCPLAHQGLQYLRHLVHLDMQAPLARLDLVFRLRGGKRSEMIGKGVMGSEGRDGKVNDRVPSVRSGSAHESVVRLR